MSAGIMNVRLLIKLKGVNGMRIDPLSKGKLVEGYKRIQQGRALDKSSGEPSIKDKVTLRSSSLKDVHFSKEELDIIGAMYLTSAEYGDDDIIKERCVYPEDPHKYVHITLRLKVKQLKAGLEVSAGVSAIIAGYLAGMVLSGGNPIGGVVGGLLGTAVFNVLGYKADKEMKDREMEAMSFVNESLKDKGITPEEAILRLRKHKPVYIVTSLVPFKTIKLTSVDDAFRKLITIGGGLSSSSRGPTFEAFRS